MIIPVCFEKIEISTVFDAWNCLTKVALSAEVSVVTACPCAVDGLSLIVAYTAVNTAPDGVPKAENKHICRWAGPGQKALDIAKNHLW